MTEEAAAMVRNSNQSNSSNVPNNVLKLTETHYQNPNCPLPAEKLFFKTICPIAGYENWKTKGLNTSSLTAITQKLCSQENPC